MANVRIQLNVTARDEHVPEIERPIRTVKERVRCLNTTLAFTIVPRRMLIELVYYSSSIFWLNTFPSSEGISDTLSPRAIVGGTQVDYNKHCKLKFGSYMHTHEPTDNMMLPRTTGAIALRPSGNDQDSSNCRSG